MHPGFAIGRVYLCRDAVDFRKHINGLSALVESALALDVFATGALFVFTNRRHTQLKILYWDRTGFCLWQKRLEQARFAWPKAVSGTPVEVDSRTLEWLLEGFDPWATKAHHTLHYQCVA
ncbi:MAG: IS66 family insertion sequence element accessory protein TnpB [Salinisphaera sp.]|nr:IS66 family insertion sequence element accessory protein TnpB [Salinisphaera sp.]